MTRPIVPLIAPAERLVLYTVRVSAILLLLACAPWRHPERGTVPPPLTRAEQSGYTATSSYNDVVTFLNTLRIRGGPIAFGSIGKTTEGRDIPYVILSRPMVATPEEARALRRPVVYVNANIHAGEVEGKEAILALVRDLLASPRPNVLDSLVLIAVPIYNADGNERFAPQSVNRSEQFGPEMVGIRSNAQRLDLNRDYVKAEAPETRSSLEMFSKWDPDVYVDLHTTDGSYHGFALTYSPSLNPVAYLPGFAGGLTRDTLLPEVRRAVRARGFETFDYGNFDPDDDGRGITDTVKQGWYSYDHRPRFGTNYYGMRGHISILSEAYSHDPFQRRIASTYAFVGEILSSVAKHSTQVVRDRGAAVATPVPIRAQLTTHPFQADIPFELLRTAGNSLLSQAGVPPGIVRTGRFMTQKMPVYDRFEPTLSVDAPSAYVIPPGYPEVLSILQRHGIATRPASAGTVSGSEFVIDSLLHDRQPFQRHLQTTLRGHWRGTTLSVPSGSTVVPLTGPLAALVVYLLEPESDDGLVTWNFFDAHLTQGGAYPVLRTSTTK